MITRGTAIKKISDCLAIQIAVIPTSGKRKAAGRDFWGLITGEGRRPYIPPGKKPRLPRGRWGSEWRKSIHWLIVTRRIHVFLVLLIPPTATSGRRKVVGPGFSVRRSNTTPRNLFGESSGLPVTMFVFRCDFGRVFLLRLPRRFHTAKYGSGLAMTGH